MKTTRLTLFTIALSATLHASPGTDALIKRMAPDHADKFKTAPLTGTDFKQETFRISATPDGKILLEGTTPVAEASAFGWYIKHIANGHFSWSGDRLPATMPLPKEPLTVSTPYRYRFAHNYCVLSYSAAFWDWARWERELDFMVSNGFNRQLVTAGLEKVWQLTLRELGYPEDRIKAYIATPAYAAWWNMGNLEGEGGPMSQALIDQEAELGRKIVKRYRELGGEPALQGFVGLLPHDIGNYAKDLGTLIPQGNWCGRYQRQIAMDPNTPAFKRLADIWYKHLHAVYGGPAKAYACDLFHEGGNPGNVNLTEGARNVQAAMQKASAGSQWIIMGWQHNPVPRLIAGTHADDRTLILQLCRNMKHGDNGGGIRTYQNRPWVWGELLNFGGNHALYGGIPLLVNQPSFLLDPANNRGNMAGIGLLSEGLETNPYYYDLFFDNIWRSKNVDLAAWLPAYLQRRYGQNNEHALKAFELLTRSVYSPDRIQEGCIESILCAKPGLHVKRAASWAPTVVYYDTKEVLAAANELIKPAAKLGKNPLYRYDLTDVTRQVMSDLARPVLTATAAAYEAGDTKAFKQHARVYLDLIKDTDTLLASDPNWLFGTWLKQARAKGKNPADKAQMETQARRLVTTWNGHVDILDDYANRQWAGLMKDYHLKRWQTFFVACIDVLEGRKPADTLATWHRDLRAKDDIAFGTATKAYPTTPKGNTVAIAQSLLKKYTPLVNHYARIAKLAEGQPWSLDKQSQTFVFDVNAAVMTKGNYKVTLQWERGQSALKIHSVALYEGDKKVAEDVHEGWTGQENRENSYLIKLPNFRTNLDTYTLRVKVSAASSVDSRGVMKIQKVR